MCRESQLPAGLIRQEFISRKLAAMSAALPSAASAGRSLLAGFYGRRSAPCWLAAWSVGARGLGDEQGVSEWLRLLVVIHGPSASIHTELGFTPKSQGVAAWAPFTLFFIIFITTLVWRQWRLVSNLNGVCGEAARHRIRALVSINITRHTGRPGQVKASSQWKFSRWDSWKLLNFYRLKIRSLFSYLPFV